MLINKIYKIVTMIKGKKLVVILLLNIILISSAYAFTASIGNPRMVLYNNITKNQLLEFENSVIVNNKNDIDLEIKIIPKDIWENRIEIKEEDKEFSLTPGERREVFYKVKIEQAGYYRGDILVSFIDDESNSYLSLAQDLVVIVQDEDGNVPGDITGGVISGNSENSGLIKPLLIGVGLILVIVLSVLLVKRK